VGAALCYVHVFTSGRTEATWALVLGTILLVHALPIACIADSWFTGRSFAGYEPSDAPVGVHRKRVARLLLIIAVLFTAAGAGMLFGGSGAAVARSRSEQLGRMSEVAVENAEPCYLIWGVKGQLLEPLSEPSPSRLDWVRLTSGSTSRYSVQRYDDFELTTAAGQRDLAEVCDVLRRPESPMNSAEKGVDDVPCVMEYMQNMQGFPFNSSSDLTAAMRRLVGHGYKSSVGFAYNQSFGPRSAVPEEVAWVYIRMHSKYAANAGKSIGDPSQVEAYMYTWKSWFDALPSAIGATSNVLSQGFVSCRSWNLYATLQAFLDGVFRALVFTPLFCMGAVFAIVRDVAICYAALLSVVGMILVTMGLLHVVGTSLGPIESLAIAVIIGVSIDYLIHLAFAYQNSLMDQRYYKSRAAMLARANSIMSAALTTLFSVVPLLGAKLYPLRQFGIIFTIVTCISTAFALGFFNVILMASGPLKTRKHGFGRDTRTAGASSPARKTALEQDDTAIQAAQLEAADDVGGELAGTPFEHDDLAA